MTDATVAILLADDNAQFRRVVQVALELEDGVVVVAEAGDGPSAVQAAVEHGPEVAVVDVNMPGVNGIHTCRSIREISPSTRVVMLSAGDDPDRAHDCIRAGASAYLPKTTAAPELADHIRWVARGETVIDGHGARRVLEDFDVECEVPDAVPDELVPVAAALAPMLDVRLTDIEREVLQAIAEGLAIGEVAASRAVTERLVRVQIGYAVSKLHRLDHEQRLLAALL